MNRPQVAILASGEGTTAEALIRESAEGRVAPQVNLVICNNKNAGIFARVDALNKQYGLHIKAVHIGRTTHPAQPGETLQPGAQTKAEEEAILRLLQDGQYDVVILLGYMKRVGKKLVHEFGWRQEYSAPHQAMLLNTHPGLLPATKGLYGSHVQEYVLKNKHTHSGQTLHVVAEDYDDGPVVAEHKVPIQPDDTLDSLVNRVRATEKQHIPKDLEAFIQNRQAFLNTEQ